MSRDTSVRGTAQGVTELSTAYVSHQRLVRGLCRDYPAPRCQELGARFAIPSWTSGVAARYVDGAVSLTAASRHLSARARNWRLARGGRQPGRPDEDPALGGTRHEGPVRAGVRVADLPAARAGPPPAASRR